MRIHIPIMQPLLKNGKEDVAFPWLDYRTCANQSLDFHYAIEMRSCFDWKKQNPDSTTNIPMVAPSSGNGSIDAKLREKKGSKGNKIFAVIDNNRAHHVSYYLAKEAIRIANCKDCIVLNIDQHADYASTKNSSLQCGNWGTHLVKDTVIEQVAVHYLAFGVKYMSLHKLEPGIMLCYNSGSPLLNTGEGGGHHIYDTDNANVFKDLLDIVLKTTKSSNVYITIDLDVLSGQSNTRTQFTNGYVPIENLDELFFSINKYVRTKHITIIGADVIGLPTHLPSSAPACKNFLADANLVIMRLLWAINGCPDTVFPRNYADVSMTANHLINSTTTF